MAIYRKEAPSGTNASAPSAESEKKRLGRGLDSLTGDNTSAEKKPLVVRRGAVEEPKPPTRSQPRSAPLRKPLLPVAGTGGRVVIRTDALPQSPLRSAKSARSGTTVLVRTERSDPPKKYRPTEPIRKSADAVRPGEPIVINPRKKKK